MQVPPPPPAPARRLVLASLASAATVLALAACSDDGREMREPSPDQSLSIITTSTAPIDSVTGSEDIGGFDTPAPSTVGPSLGSAVSSTVAVTTAPPIAPPADGEFAVSAPWPDGGEIDERHTCDGLDVSPELSWKGVPDDAVELAIVMLDDDAVSTGDGGFIHWVVAGIDPAVTSVAEGELPPGAIEGSNGFGSADAPQLGYGGQCPPAGQPAHTYRIEVHALDQQIEMDQGTIGADLLAAIDFSSIERAVVLGDFAR